MSKIFVSGITNIETSMKIMSFPIFYSPMNYCFNGIHDSISGVGFNVSKALSTLSVEVFFHSLIGDDINKRAIYEELHRNHINSQGVIANLKKLPRSIVIYDQRGARDIMLDLKDVQDKTYPINEKMLDEFSFDCAILCNINYSKDFIEYFKRKGTKIATDIHVQSNVYDSYNRPFMENADILFASNEFIRGREVEFIRQLACNYDNEIIVIGMGSDGALLYQRGVEDLVKINAVNIKPIVSTIGAGDALFSAFVHFYIKGVDAVTALKYATYFASYKIGEDGGGNGFLKEDELVKICENDNK